MIELAWISLTATDGHAMLRPLRDIRSIDAMPAGTLIRTNFGEEFMVSNSVSSLNTTIDGLWGEWITAVTGV